MTGKFRDEAPFGSGGRIPAEPDGLQPPAATERMRWSAHGSCLPRITTIIPTYNRAELVAGAIESALEQSYCNSEVIVMDDGSTDDTRSRIKPYGRHINYMYQSNRGKSAALNSAIKDSTGEWIAILDSDDRWMPEKLEFQMRALQEFGFGGGICFTDGYFRGSDGSMRAVFAGARKAFSEDIGIIQAPLDYVLNPPHGIYIQSTLIRRDLLNINSGFDERMPVGEDTDMLFRLALETKFVYVNRPLVVIDRAATRIPGLVNMFESHADICLQSRQLMYEKWLTFTSELSPAQRETIVGRLRDVHNSRANWHLALGQFKEARRALVEACDTKADPRIIAKRVLTQVAPRLSRSISLRRQRRRLLCRARLF